MLDSRVARIGLKMQSDADDTFLDGIFMYFCLNYVQELLTDVISIFIKDDKNKLE